jgi:TRAP-type C4-dicarboxylate transport system permease small subunit
MSALYRKVMDWLYLLCVIIAGASLVLISAVIPWAVFTRYVLNRAASWPEPAAVLLTIALTFFGAAACYRTSQHMRISFFTGLLPEPLKKAADLCAELVTAGLALFMAIWGAKLVEATMFNTISDFPFLSVGLTYLPIPIGGVILLLFVIERIAIGSPPAAMHEHGVEDGTVAFD